MNGSQHLDTQRVYDLLDGRLDSLAERGAGPPAEVRELPAAGA